MARRDGDRAFGTMDVEHVAVDDALRSKLARHLALWIVALMAVESLVGLLERHVFAPLLAVVLQQELTRRPQGLVEALGWAAQLVWRRLLGGGSNGVSLLAGSGAVALWVFMFLLAAAPVVLVAKGFARQAGNLVAAELRARDEEGHMNPFDRFIRSKTPAQRWGRTEDLQGLAVFLASPASDFINGQVIYIDGGILAYIGQDPSNLDESKFQAEEEDDTIKVND